MVSRPPVCVCAHSRTHGHFSGDSVLSFQETPKCSMTLGSELNRVLQEAAFSSCMRCTGVVHRCGAARSTGWGGRGGAAIESISAPHSTQHLMIGGPAPLTPGQRDIGQRSFSVAIWPKKHAARIPVPMSACAAVSAPLWRHGL